MRENMVAALRGKVSFEISLLEKDLQGKMRTWRKEDRRRRKAWEGKLWDKTNFPAQLFGAICSFSVVFGNLFIPARGREKKKPSSSFFVITSSSLSPVISDAAAFEQRCLGPTKNRDFPLTHWAGKGISFGASGARNVTGRSKKNAHNARIMEEKDIWGEGREKNSIFLF